MHSKIMKLSTIKSCIHGNLIDYYMINFLISIRKSLRRDYDEESVELLENSPIGVFQLGNNLVGPYGLLNSLCKRELRPTLSLPLWHCPSPICSNIHYVTLLNGNERLSQTSEVLLEKLDPIIYLNKEWMKNYEDIWDNNKEFFDDLLLQDLPYFLMAAFNLDESRTRTEKS